MLSGKKYWFCLGLTAAALVGVLAGILYGTLPKFFFFYTDSLNALDVVLSFLYVVLMIVLFRLIARKTDGGIWLAGVVFAVLFVTYLALIADLHDALPDPVGMLLAIIYVFFSFPLYGLAFLCTEVPLVFYGFSVVLYAVLLVGQIGVRKRMGQTAPMEKSEEKNEQLL